MSSGGTYAFPSFSKLFGFISLAISVQLALVLSYDMLEVLGCLLSLYQTLASDLRLTANLLRLVQF